MLISRRAIQTLLLTLTLLAVGAPCHAQQQQPTGADPAAEKAAGAEIDETSYAAVHNRARERAKAGQWRDALDDYRKAFQLVKGQVDWQAAGNHAWAATQVGEHAEAARMYRHAKTRLLPTDPNYADYSAKLDTRIAEARTRVGSLTVTVAPTGAEVVVQGRVEGRAPLTEPVFVMPGQCLVEVRLAGYEPSSTTVQLAAGELRTVTVQLTQAAVQQQPAPGMPAPAAAGEEPGNAAQLGVGVTFVGLGVVGIAASIVLAVTAGNRADAADMLGATVDQRAPNGNACGSGSPIEGSDDCSALASNADAALRFRAGAIGAGVTGGVLLAAGVVTLLLPSNDDGPDVAAVVTPDFAGLTVTGTF